MQLDEDFRCCPQAGPIRWRSERLSGALIRAGLVGLLLGMSGRVLAQDAGAAPIIGTATLPRDLSPWGMFLNADPVVQGVLIGLVFASIVTWTVWLAKTVEIFSARRRVRS